ncbi:MAG TPA: hypothetical protein DIT16_09120 [Clostridium sp.]|nr:hypothetical protein [Clostridium sp.]
MNIKNREEAMKHLQMLKGLYSEADTIETKNEDIKALDLAIEILCEAVQENKAHEQLCDIYPTHISLVGGINDVMAMLEDSTLIDSSEAIKIDVKINSSKYAKVEVYNAIKAMYEKLTEYFY